jgi:GDP-D-mannose dehydratase
MKARDAAKRVSHGKSRGRLLTIKPGLQKELFLGNLDAKRDWGICARVCRGYLANFETGRRRRFRSGYR